MYKTDKNALNIPWTESPFFYNLLKEYNSDDPDRALLTQYHEEGYVVVDLGLSDEEIENIKTDVLSYVEDGGKTQEGGYHYTDSPRVFEAWKKSDNVRNLANHPKVIDTLKLLYNREPLPFQTINFIKASGQPLHSDAMHFASIPHGWVAAVWVALEDMDEENGTLLFCPKSHKLATFDFKSINLKPTKYGEQFDTYEEYEKFIDNLADNFERKKFIAKKGQALIWAANLLHGGAEVIDKERTRWSQATHYYFEGCEHYYAPMFSNPTEGKYAEKDLTEKNIRGL